MRRFSGVLLLAALVGEVSSAAPPAEPPNVPRLFVGNLWNEGYFRASGFWKQHGVPLPVGATEAVDLNCYRDLKVCVEATATLYKVLGLHARTMLYAIESWSAKHIRTAPHQEPCGYFVIVIDRDPPKVYANKVNDSTRNSTCTTPGVVETMELDCVLPRSWK